MYPKTIEPMFLVDDDEVEMGERATSKVRVRVFRKKGRTPVVIVSQIDGCMSPKQVISRLANLTFGPYLGYPDCGMHFYEWTQDGLNEVVFNPVGCTLRMKHCDPRRIAVGLNNLFFTIGQKIER